MDFSRFEGGCTMNKQHHLTSHEQTKPTQMLLLQALTTACLMKNWLVYFGKNLKLCQAIIHRTSQFSTGHHWLRCSMSLTSTKL